MNAMNLMPRCPLLLLLLLTTPAVAQSTAEPFDYVEFQVSGTRNVNSNFLHEFWNRGTGAGATLSTPFYLGFVEFGGAYHRYHAFRSVPDFDALLIYTGWGLGVDVLDRIRLEGSTRVGNYRMTFDENTFAGVKHESEFALMFNARAAVRPVGPLSVYVSGSYLQAYTFLRLKLWYVSAGLSYRLRSPNWLKAVLQ